MEKFALFLDFAAHSHITRLTTLFQSLLVLLWLPTAAQQITPNSMA